MTELDRLKSEISTAEEMLRAAKEEYEKQVVELVKSGEVIPLVKGVWSERIMQDKVRYICSECNAAHVSKSNYCPNCGAKMTNAQFAPKIAKAIEREAPVSGFLMGEAEYKAMPQDQYIAVLLRLSDTLTKKYGSINKASEAWGKEKSRLSQMNYYAKRGKRVTYSTYHDLEQFARS